MKPLIPASPHAIIMVGIPGSGKSTFGEHFAETFQAPIVNVGKVQHEFNLDNKTAAAISAHFLKEYVKTKRTLLIDGGSETKKQRLELARTLIKAGYTPLIVWVQTHPGEAQRRAAKAYPKGSGLDLETFKALLKGFQPPTAAEKPVVISGKHTYITQLKVVLKQLALAPHPSPEPKLTTSSSLETPPVTQITPSRQTVGRSPAKSIRVR